jgi:hypothetical protein
MDLQYRSCGVLLLLVHIVGNCLGQVHTSPIPRPRAAWAGLRQSVGRVRKVLAWAGETAEFEKNSENTLLKKSG